MSIRSTYSSDAGSISVRSIIIKSYVTEKNRDVQIERDIRNIVLNFEIKESIYSPTLELQLSLKDQVNLMEYMNFSGQEMITIELSKGLPNSDVEDIVSLEFMVTDYPVYGKDQNANVQVYMINAISTHAYLSGTLTTISRAYGYNQGINNEIISLLKSIGINELIIKGNNVSKHRGVFPYMTPLQACEFLRKYSFDESKSPFYLYQTFRGEMNLSSHSYLIGSSNEVYSTYYESPAFQGSINSDESFQESRSRITSLASKLNMSKYSQIREGAYASTLFTIDISDKSFTRYLYSYDDSNHLNEGQIFTKEFRLGNLPLNRLLDAKIFFINVNKNLFTNNNGIGKDISLAAQKAISYSNMIDNVVNDITLAGDFNLNSGKKINLKIQKAIDPDIRKDYNPDDDDLFWDTKLSGDYLITSVVHQFKNDNYTCDVRVKKDI